MTATVLPFTSTEPQLDETVLRHDLDFILRHLGPTTLVAIMTDSRQITGRYTETADDAAAQWIIKWNSLGRNLYFHLNQPRVGLASKAAKTDIVMYYATCADVDAKNGRSMADCRAAIERLPLDPSFVTETGGGYQPIWLLAEPLPASAENMRRVEAVGEAIAALTGGDKVENVDRILRLGGTINHPSRGKRAAGRVRCMARLLNPPDPLPRYTLEQLEAAFLTAAGALPPVNTPKHSDGRPAALTGVGILGPRPAHITDGDGRVNAAVQAGIPSFANLSVDKKNSMIAAMLELPEIKALADVARDQGWRDILFALADAERLGATEARQIALDWSMSSTRFNEADFHRTWKSFDPNRDKPTTIGTLLGLASDSGIDIHSWLDGNDTAQTTTEEQPAGPEQPEIPAPRPAGTNTNGTSGANPGTGNGTGTNPFTGKVIPPASTSFFASVPFDAADLYAVPWLVSTLLIRGDVTILAGQGGGAKTALMIAIAVAMACGRSDIGPFTIHTLEGGLRVALMSAEEDPNRLGLLVAAACATMALSAAERALVLANLRVHDAGRSGWRLGEARLGHREEIAPEQSDAALALLNAALAQHQPDVLMMDTFATLLALPSEIENPLITRLMNRLARAAREAGCAVLLLHHTPKLTRAAAAEQRGEATLVRGGSAITNSARVVYTITSLPDDECALIALSDVPPHSIRRLEPAKINDAPLAPPAHVQIVSTQVTVRDGTEHAVRATRFIELGQAASGGGIADAHRNLAMKAIDAGAVDKHGARVPLGPGGGGKNNRRDPVQHIAAALRRFNAGLSEVHAKTAARELLKELRRIDCIVEREVQIPRYKANGQPNGTRTGNGLVTDWNRAPWATAATTAGTGADGPAGEADPEGDVDATATCAPDASTKAPGTGRRVPRRSPADRVTDPGGQSEQA